MTQAARKDAPTRPTANSTPAYSPARGTRAIAAVYARVANCANVVSCIVRENKTNVPIETDGYFIKAHSVFVSVVGGSDKDIAEAIYNSCSAGCDYNGNTTVSVTDSATKAVENVTFYRPEIGRAHV